MEENLQFLAALSNGMNILRQIPDISYAYNDRELIFERDKVKLYHYLPKTKQVHSIPTLVVFATVNRPEVLDLFPDRSFVRGFLDKGMDTYLLDWGYPTQEDRHLTFEEYVCDYLHACICYMMKKTKQPKVNLVGICQAGVMSLCYTALHSTINKLVLISTPVDFNTKDHKVARILKKIDIRSLTNTTGNVSGQGLTHFFISLRPFELLGQKYLRFIDRLSDQEWVNTFLRMEKWLFDAPDQAATSFAEFIQQFYQENRLIQGGIWMKGKPVRLDQITVPVLNVIAKQDEIVPPSASRALKQYIDPTLYQQKYFPSGHIGIYVSKNVATKMSKAIAGWLRRG